MKISKDWKNQKKRRFAVNCLFFLVLVFGFASGIAKAQDPPRFVLDASVDASKLDLDTWSRVVWPAMMEVVGPPQPSIPVEVRILWLGRFGGGNAAVGIGGSYPTNKSDVSEPYYRSFTHEMAHVLSCCEIPIPVSGPDPFLTEGYADAVKNLTYQKLSEAYPQIAGSTSIWMHAMNHNLPLQVGGGGVNFHKNGANGYNSAAAPFELIAHRLGGSLKKVDEAVKLAKPKSRAEYLAVVDRVVGKIDGVLPSTLFNRSPASFTGGPDGTFFGAVAYNSANSEVGEIPKVSFSSAPVNPLGAGGLLFTRQGGTITYHSSFQRYVVTNASGNAVFRSATLAPEQPIPQSQWLSNLPEGGYKATVCVLQSDNTCDPNLADYTFFLMYNKPWHRDKVFVIANSGKPLRVVDTGGATSVEVLPDLLVFHNSRRDITVTDGVMSRVVSPTPLSRIVFFQDKDQPYLKAVVNAATLKEGPLVPGSIATLFTWGATQGDPETSQLPLPTAACGGRTQVEFIDSDGRALWAPLFHCSQLQLNIQVPRDLRGPTAWVRVKLGDTFSNQVEVPVADVDPSIFIIDPATQTGAVIFASGERVWQLVTPENPAKPGDFLSVFATGLGETMPSLPGDGIATPPPAPPPSAERPTAEQLNTVFALYSTLRPVTASAGTAAWRVLWSGLTPGFVGLYQVNVQVPDTAPGIYPFAIAVEGNDGERRTSNEVLIAVQ